MSSFFIGLDVDSKKFVSFITDEMGNTISKPKSFPNSPSGAQSFLLFLLELISKSPQPISSILIGTESTSIYDWHLANFLSESEELSSFSTKVYRLNALRLNRFRKSLSEFNKTDKTDAEAIANYLRLSKSLPSPHVPNDPYSSLKTLTRYRYHLVKTIIREINTFLSYLFLQYSAIVQTKPMKPLIGHTISTLLSSFSPEQLVSLSLTELASLISKESKNRCSEPQKISQLIQKAVRESYRLRPELSRTLTFILANLVRTIRALRNNLKEINKAVSEELKSFPNTLTTIPGVGEILAAGIIAEIGNIKKFQSHNQLAKLAGFVWPEYQTGNFTAQDKRMPKSSNKYLRYYLTEAANGVRKYDSVFSEYYWKKYQETRTHQHKRALALTTRKFIRLVFNILSTNLPYQPKRSNAYA